MDSSNISARVRQAAFELATERPWSDITLHAIAARAGMSLAELATGYSSKSDILIAFAREIDSALLKSLETDPVEGEPHDRLFDLMLRRLELLTPHKPALKNIVLAQASSPQEWLTLLSSNLQSQNWILASAGLETSGLESEVHKLGLAKIYADVLRIWLDEDDPGMARTMAALDRKLRDAEAILRRLETPLAFCKGLVRAISAFRETRKRQTFTSDATAD